ncbi:MAG TPA: sulfatase [Verrucomicrobiales bacterium]|nr:sulfatase [Verrucomicrobiales bacterium]
MKRRHFLNRMSNGLAGTALSQLMAQDTPYAQLPHYRSKAKRIIFLYMAGGPSQFDTFDDKPELRKRNGQAMPEDLTKGVKLAFLQNSELKCFGSKSEFTRCGKSGQNISNLLPKIQKIADDICIVRTQQTDQVNHDPAHMFMNTGTAITGRPSMGSWVSYGLGNIASNLPDFVVMRSGPEGQPVPQVAWNSGFLPGKHSGVEFYSSGSPLNYLNSPTGIKPSIQRDTLDGLSALNSLYGEHARDPEVRTRIAQYELAFKMQSSVPDVADFSAESTATRELYGAEDKPNGSFASNCLMARRMAERGVRFVQLYHTGWDHHGNIAKKIKDRTKDVDQGTAALITDLKQRGMLEDTLVIWGGEFGRTPMSQGTGRDHHTKSGSMFLAGGGIKGGTTYGETDPFGFTAVNDPFHVHDFHATMLHLLGINHLKLTYKYAGRNFRLTDVHGHVVKKILA